MRALGKRWLPLVVTTSAALTVWALAAAHGYGWQTTWLPPRSRVRPGHAAAR